MSHESVVSNITTRLLPSGRIEAGVCIVTSAGIREKAGSIDAYIVSFGLSLILAHPVLSRLLVTDDPCWC